MKHRLKYHQYTNQSKPVRTPGRVETQSALSTRHNWIDRREPESNSRIHPSRWPSLSSRSRCQGRVLRAPAPARNQRKTPAPKRLLSTINPSSLYRCFSRICLNLNYTFKPPGLLYFHAAASTANTVPATFTPEWAQLGPGVGTPISHRPLLTDISPIPFSKSSWKSMVSGG